MLTVPLTPPRRAVAIFDFDGTIVRADSTARLLAFLAARHPHALRDLAGVAVLWPAALAGLVARERLKRMAIRALRHVPAAAREAFLLGFLQRCLRPRYRPAAIERIGWHRERGDLLVLASASVDLYLRHVARLLDFDSLVCTRAALDPVPDLIGPNCRGAEKVRRLSREPFFENADWDESWAYSDDASDLPMLGLCGHPVAVNPGGRLKRHAVRERWEIVKW